MPDTATTVQEYTLYTSPGASLNVPAVKSRGIAVPVTLFFATLITTSMMGARFAANFDAGLPPLTAAADLVPLGWIVQDPLRLIYGLPFSLTVMTILLAHELGHYFACKRHDVKASLPYFLPAPTLSGTAGAIIRLRTRVQSRAALIDIGVSGPFWGFLFALPLTLFGLMLSQPSTQPVSSAVIFNAPVFPLLNSFLSAVHPGWPSVSHLVPHPVLLGAWIGMFVTFLNMLPAGQLDGGHILYALFPKRHRLITNSVAFLLLLWGIFFWMGWLLWGVVLMMPFMRHPQVAQDPKPTAKDWFYAIVGLVILLLAFTPQPFHGGRLIDFVS